MTPRLALLAGTLALLLWPAPARAQSVDSTLWIPNDIVYATARAGDTLFVGGQFTYVGPNTGGLAAVSDADGSLDRSFPVVGGTVNVIVPDGTGGWYLGGAFTSVGGQARAGLARLNADRSLSAWDPGCNGTVQAICLAGARLYVGGQFTAIGGMTRTNLAAFDAATGDSSALPTFANAAVNDLAYANGLLFACGSFTTIGAAARSYVAALDTATGLATAWNANANAVVRTLAIDGGTLFLGGNFTSIGGSARSFCAAFDVATGALDPFAPSLSGAVYVVAPSATVVRVGGQFSNSGGQPRAKAAAFDRTTSALTAWNPRADNLVQSIVATNDGVLLGGAFRAVGDSARYSLARVDSVTGALLPWNCATGGAVVRLRTDGTRVLVCGTFSSAGGAARNRAAAFDLRTGAATGWDPNVNGTVRTLLVSGSSVYLGGAFTEVGGTAHGFLAATDALTGAADAWDADLDAPVYALAADTTHLYAGGQFTLAGGVARTRLASFSLATHALGSLNPAVDNIVWALTVSNGRLFVGGDFLNCGAARTRAAAIDLATNQTTSWNPIFNGSVYALASDAKAVYAGGAFTTMAGLAKPYLASVNPLTGTTTNTTFASQPNGRVGALARMGSVLILGGEFTSVGSAARARLAAVDTVTGLLTGWAPAANGSVNALSVGDGGVVAGGAFTQVNGAARPFLVGTSVPVGVISVSDVTIGEGSNGAWTVSVPVSRVTYTPAPVSVHWVLSDSTATAADGDYTAASGTFVAPAGQEFANLSVEVNGDRKFEPTERFIVTFDSPIGATLANTRAVVTLTNDDPIPSVSISDVALPEGHSGTTAFPFVVTLSNPSYLAVTVQHSTSDGVATVASGDYAALSGVTSIPPGTTSETFTVSVAGDSTLELDETFFVDLSGPVNATIADGRGVGTILTDEVGPVLRSVTDVAGDQGGWVWLTLDRALFDVPEETVTPVLTYNVWRRLSAAPLAKSAAAIASAGPIPAIGADALAALASWPVEMRSGRVVLEASSAKAGPAAHFPPGTWAIVGSFAAMQASTYQVLAPTVTDSPLVSHFVLSAHTLQPSIWWVGSPNSGSSLDNIAPGVPSAFAANVASGAVALTWAASEARDFQYFRVHRGTSEAFVPDTSNLVHETAALAWSDVSLASGTRWYKLVALDHAGNASAPAAASVTLTLAAGPELPRAFALSAPSPNPFSGRATIELAVPREAAARVAVYDVSGRLVRELLAGGVAPGRHALEWDGRDARGARAGAGLYFVRLEAAGRIFVRRCVLAP